jgi:nucleoside phosphorylase
MTAFESALAGRRGHARIAVLTVIDEEFEALQNGLGAYHEIGATGIFSPVMIKRGFPSYPFVLSQSPSRSNTPASLQTRRLIEFFRPEVIVLVGIAGGIQRPRISDNTIIWQGPKPGDVVVAEYVHYADFTKNVSSGHHLRFFPLDHPSATLVAAHALAVSRTRLGIRRWDENLSCARPFPGSPAVHVGEIVAVEGIAGDPSSEHQAELIRRFDHALAVDMESMGVARAIHESRDQVYYNPVWLCVRTISDEVRSSSELNSILSDEGDISIPVSVDNDQTRSQWKEYSVVLAARFTTLLLQRMLMHPRPACPSDPGAPLYRFPTIRELSIVPKVDQL